MFSHNNHYIRENGITVVLVHVDFLVLNVFLPLLLLCRCIYIYTLGVQLVTSFLPCLSHILQPIIIVIIIIIIIAGNKRSQQS